MRRVTLVAAGAVLTGLALAGCGAKQDASGGGSNSGANAELGTLKILAQSVGEKSAAKPTGHFTMSVGASSVSLTGNGEFRLGTDPAMRVTMTVPGQGELSLVLVNETMYVKLPKDKELKAGKPWLKIDPAGDDAISKSLASAVEQMKTSGDPSATLKQLADVGEITAKKQESLNGKDTTHYSITVDLRKAAVGKPAELVEKAKQAGVESFPVELWLDADNLPVRLSMETPFKNPASGRAEQVKVSIDYSDWGTPVTLTAPPADQVTEMPKR